MQRGYQQSTPSKSQSLVSMEWRSLTTSVVGIWKSSMAGTVDTSNSAAGGFRQTSGSKERFLPVW